MNEEIREARECARGILEDIAEDAQVVWRVTYEPRRITVLSESDAVATYNASEGSGVLFRTSSGVVETSYDAFRQFCEALRKSIAEVEKDILIYDRLIDAASAIRTLLRREIYATTEEELRAKPLVERLFKRRCNEVRAVASYYSMMPQFPAAIFEEREVFAPKPLFLDAQRKLYDLARQYSGQTLRIDNMRGLTLSFEKKGCLIFDPLSKYYYTEDEMSQRFKEQLAKFS